MRRYDVIAIVAAALALVAVLRPGTAPASVAPSAVVASVPSAPARVVSSSDPRLAALEAQVEALAASGPPERSRPEPAGDPEEAAILAEERLEDAFSVEPEDPAWAGEMYERIARSMANEEAQGMSVVAETCRQRVCRVHLSADTPESLERWLGAMPFQAPWNTKGHVAVDPDDPLKVSVYVAREGHDLPRAP